MTGKQQTTTRAVVVSVQTTTRHAVVSEQMTTGSVVVSRSRPLSSPNNRNLTAEPNPAENPLTRKAAS